ncbi:hypothetical protein [Saccharomonospora viridis]|jgi:hypothetical protein|uniref:Uncharacterized protein n=1 Tax=Saccharomonospora viridis (strain ATCC 15386 / DSM 43017 / JCM 3036 / CCUG 5913 / NBRC 12207 / NCIMB 9602 / P101) TaxID=471857 RepID=C7MUM9_SACVD|nr:hypothetical protein [Saccharomonospora viridis]ACU95592.1 hypothetical protein Svir_05180 [Saccharomonospora viridis DSM 43017]
MNTATYVPPTREQVDTIRRVLVHERDIERAAILLAAATCPSVKIPRLHAAEAATIRAQRPPAHHDLPAALLRITRAIDTETEGLYHHQDAGHPNATPALRAIAFRLLELGFTIAEHAGLHIHDIETAVALVYDLPGYGDEAPQHRKDHGISGK